MVKIVTLTPDDQKPIHRSRDELMDRRAILRRANNEVQKVINEDLECKDIDGDTAHLLREAFFQVLMAVDDHNILWHVEEYGSDYPDNTSVENDWTIWHLNITAPVTRTLPMENDHEVRL